jgi:hypothetical protein
MTDSYEHDPYPEIDELEQLETDENSPFPISPIPVVVDEIKDMVRTIIVPNRDVIMSQITVVDGPAVKVIGDDKRRARLTLMPQLNSGNTSTSIRFSTNREDLDNGQGAPWPARPPGSAPASPLIINSSKGVWAKLPPGDLATCVVSYIAEIWAD